MRIFTTEQISKYHPDKYADQISDAILSACLKQDPKSRVACETMCKNNTVIIAGEITTNAKIDYQEIVLSVAKKLNYQVDDIINLISTQSPEIGNAVNQEQTCAGDQGIMFGYACDETDSYLPLGFDLANKIIEKIEKDVENNKDTILKGDAKTQVSVDLDSNKVTAVLVSVCHNENITLKNIQDYIAKLLVDLIPSDAQLTVNPAGTWNVGGPTSDCGLTGRKIVCDQYGGYCAVGGGAFSGKDPSKVDRSATYMARRIAVDLVKEFNLKSCEVQLSYMIGRKDPMSVIINPIGKNKLPDVEYVVKHYDLTPDGIIKHLDLLNLDYELIAGGNHMKYFK